jgi:hypothetical protein
MLVQLLPVTRDVNRLRKLVKLGLVGDIPLSTTPNEARKKDDEENRLEAAVIEFGATLDAKFDALKRGAESFNDRVKYTPPPEPPSLWESIATAALTAVIGNVLGFAVKGITGMRKVTAIDQEMLGRTSATVIARPTLDDIVTGTINDSSQGITSAILGTVEAARGDSFRDQRVFADGLMAAKDVLEIQSAKALADDVRANTVTAADVEGMTKELAASNEQSLGALTESVFREASAGFALLLAAGSVGDPGKIDANGKVNGYKLDGYFDVRGTSALDIHTREGSAGVGKLWVNLTSDGELELGSFAVHGMNDDMAQAIWAHAKNGAAGLGIPLEIHFNVKRIGGYYAESPKLVLDEKGSIRHKHDWEIFDGLTLYGKYPNLRSAQAIVSSVLAMTSSSIPFRSAK